MRFKYLFKLFCISVCSLFFVEKLSAAPALASSFSVGLDRIIKQAPSNVHIGVLVRSMQTGTDLYAYNSNFLFSPASVQKLFVGISSLAFLKPDFVFDTRILTNGQVVNGVVQGDLAIQFVGDPTLNKSDVINLLSQLKAQGIRNIEGHVYIDNTAYDNVPYPPGWFWDDLSYNFAAPVNGVIINKNQFSFILTPGPVGTPAVIKSSLPGGVIKIRNETNTTSGHQSNCSLMIYSDFENDYKIAGCVPHQLGTQYRSAAIRDPVIYAQVLTENYLRDNQISFQGPVEVKAASNFSTVLASHHSAPLYLIVKQMLKHSDNLITDAILKKMGQVYYNTQGNWRNGVYAMRGLLAPKTGINFNKISLIDGAGLSRYNLLTPNSLVELLYYAYHQNQVLPYLLNALPIAGVDGTLRWRMPNFAKGQIVHAKTGTMKSITCLAGYIKTQNNGTLGFAILINGFVDRYAPYRALADRLCEYLYTAPRA